MKKEDYGAVERSDIFRKVEEHLKAKGYERTAAQLSNKFEAMKKQFISAKNAMSKSGAGTEAKRKCPFYEELDEIFSFRPTVNQKGVDSTVLLAVLDEDTSGYHASDSEVSSVMSQRSSTSAKRKSVQPIAGCSSWPSTSVTCDMSPILPATPMAELSDHDDHQSGISMHGSDDRSLDTSDGQHDTKKPKYNSIKRDTPRSGLKNVLNDFADRMIKSQNDLVEKMLMEQRHLDRDMMTQYNNIFTQQTQLLLAGLHSLSSNTAANYATSTPPMPPSNFIFAQNTSIRPSNITETHRRSNQSESPVMAFTTTPPDNSTRPTAMSQPSLIKTTIIRSQKDMNKQSRTIAATQSSTPANTLTIPSRSELSQLISGNDDEDSDVTYEDIEFLDFNHFFNKSTSFQQQQQQQLSTTTTKVNK